MSNVIKYAMFVLLGAFITIALLVVFQVDFAKEDLKTINSFAPWLSAIATSVLGYLAYTISRHAYERQHFPDLNVIATTEYFVPSLDKIETFVIIFNNVGSKTVKINAHSFSANTPVIGDFALEVERANRTDGLGGRITIAAQGIEVSPDETRKFYPKSDSLTFKYTENFPKMLRYRGVCEGAVRAVALYHCWCCLCFSKITFESYGRTYQVHITRQYRKYLFWWIKKNAQHTWNPQ